MKMTTKKACFGVVEDTVELGGMILIVAVLIGTVDLPLFYGVSTTGWGAPNIIMWGIITIVSIAFLIMEILKVIKPYRQ